MAEKAILVIDLGTSKVHANIISVQTGRLLTNATESYRWLGSEKGFVEICAEDIWQAAQSAAEQVLAQANAFELTCLTFSWFGAELVTLDANGNEVLPLIVSFDSRAAEEAEVLQEKVPPEIRACIGRGGLNAESNPAKVLWLKRNHPEEFSRIRWLGTIEQYFYHKLGFEICAEKSMLQTLQFHRDDGSIFEEIYSAAGCPEGCFDYPVYDGDGILGEITQFGRLSLRKPLPVLYGGHDCILSQLGSGVLPEGNDTLGDVCGTYDLMGFMVPEQTLARGEMQYVNTPLSGVCAYLNGAPSGALLDASVVALWGHCDSHLLTRLFACAQFDAAHGGLWAEETWDTLKTQPSSVAAYGEQRVFESLVEEITFELYESYLDLCRKNGGTFQIVRAGGGATKSQNWLQLKADVFNAVFELPENPEVSAMGAAIIAAVVLREYPTYAAAVDAMVHPIARYAAKNAQAYHRLYERWSALRKGTPV